MWFRRVNAARHFSPDEAEIVRPLLYANMIFMGPGSPTYATRQLKDSLAWEIIRARHRLGATLAFASAATISIGAWAIPVYEIYKVGEDVHTKTGLKSLCRLWNARFIGPALEQRRWR